MNLSPVVWDVLAWAAFLLTAMILALLIPFALHRLLLLRSARRRARHPDEGRGVAWEGPLPRVTVQLPVYNEVAVVDRLLDAVAALDYPRHLLEIQVLDDSTDGTSVRVSHRVDRMHAVGLRAEHIRRGSREGFKAGALEAGRRVATGDFILILDADFVPGPGLIRDLLPPFADSRVGMVQARWDHLNEDESLLTRCQALFLDGHFFFEQGGRHAAGRFMSFNGTAGMWRSETLESAGGWSAETLTEDLDVSYRAQMEGWKFVFLPEVGVPAELPATGRALELQQQRWAQGGIQAARKLLGPLWRGGWPVGIRLEGTIHLLGHLAHPLTVGLGVLLLPSAIARRHLGLDGLLFLDLLIFGCATLSFFVFFAAAGRMRDRPWRRVVPTAIAAMVLGVGLTAPVSRAVLRGIGGGGEDPFIRTPKTGRTGRTGSTRSVPRAESSLAAAPLPSPPTPAGRGEQRLEVGLALLMAGSIGLAAGLALYGTIPLLLLFGSGWAWMAREARTTSPPEVRSQWAPSVTTASQPSSPP